tara:strand:- start:118 stop:354 length:237 start_codon:yes stop_codon:yes gene_type:complete
MGGKNCIFKLILDLYQSLQKNKVLLALLASVNKQTRLNDAFNEIGTCIKAITIRSLAIDDGLVLNEFLFLKDNLFREV